MELFSDLTLGNMPSKKANILLQHPLNLLSSPLNVQQAVKISQPQNAKIEPRLPFLC